MFLFLWFMRRIKPSKDNGTFIRSNHVGELSAYQARKTLGHSLVAALRISLLHGDQRAIGRACAFSLSCLLLCFYSSIAMHKGWSSFTCHFVALLVCLANSTKWQRQEVLCGKCGMLKFFNLWTATRKCVVEVPYLFRGSEFLSHADRFAFRLMSWEINSAQSPLERDRDFLSRSLGVGSTYRA